MSLNRETVLRTRIRTGNLYSTNINLLNRCFLNQNQCQFYHPSWWSCHIFYYTPMRSCYLIWPCDTTVCITYLISHSYSLTYNLRIFQFGCIINTKLPSYDDINHRTSLGFPSWCPESRVPAVKTS